MFNCPPASEVVQALFRNKRKFSLIKSLEDIIFNSCKNKVGFYRSKTFKDWFHKEYPDKEMHHVFGSYTSIKTSDYCSIPVPFNHANSKAEKDKSQFAIDNFPLLLEVMIKYILHLEKKNRKKIC